MSIEHFDSIYQSFPGLSAEEWKAKICKDLKGDSFEKLIWHTNEGFDVLPFYTKEDNKNYQLNIPKRLTNGWQIAERIVVNNIETANAQALLALENGATSIFFDVQHQSLSQNDVFGLVKNILLDIAPVTFENFNSNDKYVFESIVNNNCTPKVSVPKLENITEELVFALQEGIQQKTNSFHFLITSNYFFEIAKLRAFRWLWKQASTVHQLPTNANIIAETCLNNLSKNEENTNLLRNTTMAMSAILGTCDVLLVQSHNAEDNGFAKRMARNIQHILQHESNFDKMQDAAKGSYYIEYLTYQFCMQSWNKFTAQ